MSSTTPKLLRRVLAPLTGIALVAAVLGATSTTASADDNTQYVSRGVTIPKFYNPPSQLPAKNGTLIRSEPMKIGLSIPGITGPLPGKATRIMYKSTDAKGQAVAVSGAYVEPTVKWKGKGQRPLAVVAYGTVGQGDQCSPSMGLENPLRLQLSGEISVAVGYDNLAAYQFLARGVAVVFTDYVGLGTTDRLHTYMNRVDQGHAVLDAARAAVSLPESSVTSASSVGFYGYSQGGGATGAAVELHPSYAPDVNLKGAYVGAPPADLVKTVDGIDGSLLAAALAWTINGLLQYEPGLTPMLDKYMNDKGKKYLTDSADKCIGEALGKYAFAKTKDLTKTGITLSDVIKKEPQIKALVDAQRIGKIKPTVPVRLATGTSDDTVPHKQSRQLAVDWCKLKANVTYVPVIMPNMGNKLLLNHLAPAIADQTIAVGWVTDRLNGKKATSNCVFMPILP